jgi:hypothetical protein
MEIALLTMEAWYIALSTASKELLNMVLGLLVLNLVLLMVSLLTL